MANRGHSSLRSRLGATATGANTMPLGPNSGATGGSDPPPTTRFGGEGSEFGSQSGGFGSGQGQGGFGGNRPPSGGFGSSQRTSFDNDKGDRKEFGSNQGAPSGAFGSNQGAPSGAFGSSQGRPTGGFGSGQGQGGFGSGQGQGGFDGNRPPSGGFGSSQRTSFDNDKGARKEFGNNQDPPSGAFGSNQGAPSGAFGSNQGAPSGAFGSNQGRPSGGFGSNQERPSGGFGSNRERPSGGFGSNQERPSGGFGSSQGPQQGASGDNFSGQSKFGGFGGHRREQNFGNNEDQSGGDGQGFGRPPRADENSFGERADEGQRQRPDRREVHVPVNRDLSEIFGEDDKSRSLYSGIVDDDEAVEVEGLKGAPVPVMETWTDIALEPEVMSNIERSGYIRPRKIQAYSIPIVLAGHDIKGQAETGSGKSAAFLIPLINEILKLKKAAQTPGTKNRPRALIIEPTRELALQLYEQGRKLANDTGVQVVKSYGQYDYKRNAEEIILGCDIVVGTPGRVISFIEEGIIDLENLKYFVLDEADRMLEGEFKDDMMRIAQFKAFPEKEKRQTLLFSATFPSDLESFANEILRDDHIKVHNKRLLCANSKIEQEFVECEKHRKKSLLLEILQREVEAVKAQDAGAKMPRTLVFVERKRDADLMSMFLCENGVKSTTINGDRPQHLRELALNDFRSNECPVLVATDVCARGLDIKDLDYVINMDLPKEITTYVHRIGRTGRLKKGKATSFFDPGNDAEIGAELEKLLSESNKEVPEFIKNTKEDVGFQFAELPGGAKAEVSGF